MADEKTIDTETSREKINQAKEMVKKFYLLQANNWQQLQHVFDMYHSYNKEIEYMAANAETNKFYLAIDRLYKKSIENLDKINYAKKQQKPQSKKDFYNALDQQSKHNADIFTDVTVTDQADTADETATESDQSDNSNLNFLF